MNYFEKSSARSEKMKLENNIIIIINQELKPLIQKKININQSSAPKVGRAPRENDEKL